MSWRATECTNQNVARVHEVSAKDVYTCGICGGTGLLFSKVGIEHPVCSGEGKANIPHLAVICAYCDGTGKRNERSGLPCLYCLFWDRCRGRDY